MRSIAVVLLVSLFFLATLLPVGAEQEATTSFYALRVGDEYALSPNQDEEGVATGAWGSSLPVAGAGEAIYTATGREWVFPMLAAHERTLVFTEGEIDVEIWFGSSMGAGVHNVGWELSSGDEVVAEGAPVQVQVAQDFQMIPWTIKTDARTLASPLVFRVYTEESVGAGARLLLGPQDWTKITLPVVAPSPELGSDRFVWSYENLTGDSPSTTVKFDGKDWYFHVLNWSYDAPGLTLDVTAKGGDEGTWYVTVHELNDPSYYFDLSSRDEPYGGKVSHFGPGHDFIVKTSSNHWQGELTITLTPQAEKGPPVAYAKPAGTAGLVAGIVVCLAAAVLSRRD